MASLQGVVLDLEALSALIAVDKRKLYFREYYDKNRERILEARKLQYNELREHRIANGEFKKRGPKPKPREVTITVELNGSVCVE